jgi:4-diphosphocytidyl-2-C-methyl-D-erythritol kinase
VQCLTVIAPAKVNLFLGIGQTRPDGHHDLVSVFQTLQLHDTLRLTPSDELTVHSDIDVECAPQDNLAYRAARAFSAAFGVDVIIDIAIEKRIPAGAGLAGGSSDAAAVLAGLANWASLPLADPRLLAAAASVGADVPFFLHGGAALMTGRGDHLERRLPDVAFDLVLVKPAVGVSTAAAYRAFDADPRPLGDWSGVEAALRAGSPMSLGAHLANNMTPASVSLVPEVGDALAWTGAQDGIFGALVSGSGSSVFGVCRDAATAERVARDAQALGLWAVATASRPEGVHVTGEEECS